MRGLILSGGKGTRLRPITHTSAKQLVPVANKPVLYYAVESLVEAGITDIGVITGDTRSEIEAALGTGERFGAKFTIIPQSAPKGLAHAVLTAKEFIGNEPFVMYLGDNLIMQSLRPLVKSFTEKVPSAMILLAHVKEPERFGVVELKAGKVVKLVEKPDNPPSDLALVGVYLFGPDIFEAIDAIDYSERGELEITDALQKLIDTGKTVLPNVVKGWWKDTGRLEDMLEANRIVLESLESRVDGTVGKDTVFEGRVVVEEGATVVRSLVRGPAIIGRDTVIEDAYIGPFTAISYGCSVRRAEIEHSIVLENSTIEDVPNRIESSLIGKGCVVSHGRTRPVAVRLMLGDNSKVEV